MNKDKYEPKEEQKQELKEEVNGTQTKEDQQTQFEQKVDDKDQRIRELTDTLQRLQADFENYKKRVDKEKQEFMQFATKEFIKLTLPIIDNFELAFSNKQSYEDFKKGIELIFVQMREILTNHGVTEIPTNGGYNPQLHEAMMTAKDENKEDNIILEVFQKGYTLGERVIRHAKVKVNRLDNKNKIQDKKVIVDNNKEEIDENKDNKKQNEEQKISSSEE